MTRRIIHAIGNIVGKLREVAGIGILDEIDKLYKEIAALQPLSESLQKQLRAYYRIGLTYASNALEGNSLTETETKVLLEDGLTVGGKPVRDHFEAIGHGET